mmetsp:Transcript_110492/g.312536  ORF Transcript_110492/g.312536 Transcript_110492/m.312536 type:complete len:90 (-) Transcript_110492:164-433(-)
MSESLEILRARLHESVAQTEAAIDMALGQLDAERASLEDAEEALQEQLAQVSKIHADLQAQKALQSRGFFSCCMRPASDANEVTVVTHE